ncbi:MAG TPA: TlpA disulfide reductase family protein [Rhodocyclaceae bacterium]|nr:TlpA disulfide reductase family protein [Rhodocyclaceae bacterium]
MGRRWLGLLCMALIGSGAWADDFALTDIHNQPHSLAAYRGKWVLLNFWASWCVPCQAEMPELEALSRSRPDLVVIGVSGDIQRPERLEHFARQLKATFPMVAANDQTLAQFGVRLFPTSLLFDRAGNKAMRFEGAVTRKQLEEVLQH